MAIQLEAYTAWGIIRGTVTPDARLADVLETSDSVALAEASLDRLDRRQPQLIGSFVMAIDDVFAALASPETPLPSVAAWHQLVLIVGPYEIHGSLPAQRGLDPHRSLLRPGGNFTLLAHVRVVPRGRSPDDVAELEAVWVNRYAVEEVVADLDLGVFFPGAAIAVIQAEEEDYLPAGS